MQRCSDNLQANSEELKEKIATGTRKEIGAASARVYTGYAAFIEESKPKLEELRKIKRKDFDELRADIKAAEKLGASNFEQAEKIRKQKQRSLRRSSGGYGYY